MKEIIRGSNRLFFAKEYAELERTTDYRYVRGWFNYAFFRRRLFRELVGLHARRHGLRGRILLQGHGGFTNATWCFFDGRRPHNLQRWIERHDGEAAVICLVVCNENNRGELATSRSALIHFTDNVNVLTAWRGGKTRLFLPPFGYLDSQYQLRRAFTKLKIRSSSLSP